MTTMMSPGAIQETSDDDNRAALRNALAYAGYSWDELADQARRREFASMKAQLAWMTVRNLAEYR